jgi:catechol 2,3-dioxygenase-like lactoylglutathione lyase family enzyme
LFSSEGDTVAFERTEFADAVPLWRGFHHVALVTPDLDATIRFYGDVLGMRVGEVISATERQGRHCFIKPGDTVETWGLHFFERPDAEVFAYPETFERYAFVPGALQHVAFALPDEAAALALRRRLTAFGVEMTDTTNLGEVSNMLFRDNSGLLLEAAWVRS